MLAILFPLLSIALQITPTVQFTPTGILPNALQADSYFERNVTAGAVPAPLPKMPEPVPIYSVDLPEINVSAWPSSRSAVDSLFEEVDTAMSTQLTTVRSRLNTQYSAVLAQVSSVRQVTNDIKAAIGDPLTINVRDIDKQGNARVTTVSMMAAQLTSSTRYAIGYMRALSNLGPLGLDLLFVFIGLGWMVFINILAFLIEGIAWFLKQLGRLKDEVIKLLSFLLDFIRTILLVIDIIVDIIGHGLPF